MDGADELDQAADDGEGMAPWLVAASVAATTMLLLLAVAVLLGLPLPRRSAGASRAGAVPVISAPREVASPPLPVLTAVPPTPAPFVLRPPAPLIDRSASPVPGSDAAAIAGTPACVTLRTGQGRDGFWLGDGLLDLIARAHPECP